MANYKQMVVVDGSILDLPEDVYDELSSKLDLCNGSYHRWYPNRPAYGCTPAAHKAVQDELIAKDIPMEQSEYYTILLYFNW